MEFKEEFVPTGYGSDAMLLDILMGRQPPASSGDGAPTITALGNKSSAMPTGVRKGGRRATKSPAAAKASIQESRKKYRERVKREANETKEKFAQVSAELARLKLEQEQLQCDNTVLESMCRYSESAVSFIRSAAASISTLASDSASQFKGAAHTSIMTLYGELVDTVWSRFLRPSDDQLRKLATYGQGTLDHREPLLERLQTVMAEWRISNPAGRELIERKISYAFETRARVARILLNENHEVIKNVFNFRKNINKSEEARAIAIANRNQLLDNDDLVIATVLTEEQRIALRRHWKLYVAHFQKSKNVVHNSTSVLEKSLDATKQGSLPHEPSGNLSTTATSHLALQQASTSLEELTLDEMIARVNLALGCINVLSPIQLAYVVIGAMPDCDMICDIIAVYKALLRMEGAAFAMLKHDYELPNSSGGSGSGASGSGGGASGGSGVVGGGAVLADEEPGAE